MGTGAASRVMQALHRKHVLAGLLFAAIGALGLWISRNYPVGTALRMGTGYMPRLLCWMLIGLGALTVLQGARDRDVALVSHEGSFAASLWPLLVVSGSLVVFALVLEQLGLVIAIALLVAIGSLAARDLRIWETAATALFLIALSWAIFIRGLGLTIPVWPEW